VDGHSLTAFVRNRTSFLTRRDRSSGGRRQRFICAFAFGALLTACAPFARSDTPTAAPPSETRRVVTYNIHHGAGLDDRVDLERIAALLARLDPDVVALQEVDRGVTRSGGEDQARRLGDLLGMRHAFGAFMDYQGGQYGMAILSRCPIVNVNPARLPDGNEPRVALAVQFERPTGGVLTVIDVHFDWVGDDAFRFAQARAVASVLHTLSTPYILAGDFNDHPGSRTMALFHERATEADKPESNRFTFSADDPRREIDFIFVSRAHDWTVRRVEVVPERVASDHMPVVAELVLRRSAEDMADAREVAPARRDRCG
jgi:endonuclease/exonuclease/phosphatase family metal-dependent hydrolase